MVQQQEAKAAVTVRYPSLQDGERGEPGRHAGGGQQVAPHAQGVVVNLEEAEDVETPRQAGATVPRQDETPPQHRGDVHVPDGGGEEGEARGGRGKRHLRHHGILVFFK